MRMLIISSVVAGAHFFEDLALVLLGRYTEINIPILMVATILFGILIGGVSRNPKGKRYLSK